MDVPKPLFVARRLRVSNFLPRLINPDAEPEEYQEALGRICYDAVTGKRFSARDQVWVQAKGGTLILVVSATDLDYTDVAERPNGRMVRAYFLHRCPGRHFRKHRSKRREHPSLKSEQRESRGRKLRKRRRTRHRRKLPVRRRGYKR